MDQAGKSRWDWLKASRGADGSLALCLGMNRHWPCQKVMGWTVLKPVRENGAGHRLTLQPGMGHSQALQGVGREMHQFSAAQAQVGHISDVTAVSLHWWQHSP